MRSSFVVIHRWAGLFIAVFLFVAGLTGAVISWDHELDEWLNPDLFETTSHGPTLGALDLARRVEAADPRVMVTYAPLAFEKGRSAVFGVDPRMDPRTGTAFDVDYNQIFLDPVTGQVQGKRFWGRIALDRENLLPFLYKLHYSMHIPDLAGVDELGIWILGIVGIVWMFDCFVGFYLTLPAVSARNATAAGHVQPSNRSWWQRWRRAWKIRFGASSYRVNFDLHRAFGLWLWLVLFVIAFTSISMNLGGDVVRPLLSMVSPLTPGVFDSRTPTPVEKPISPIVPFSKVVDAAGKEAAKRGWSQPPGSLFYAPQYGIYGVSFFQPGHEHGSGGMGTTTLYLDGKDARVVGDHLPWEGTAADLFMQLQFPLHSGRIAGLPGRVLLSVMGLVVAMLSLTGIYIWFKKRAARRSSTRVVSVEKRWSVKRQVMALCGLS